MRPKWGLRCELLSVAVVLVLAVAAVPVQQYFIVLQWCSSSSSSSSDSSGSSGSSGLYECCLVPPFTNTRCVQGRTAEF